MKTDAQYIIGQTIRDVLPDRAVREKLETMELSGRVYLVSIGKAAWVMAKTAADCLGERLEKGLVVTKYDHVPKQEETDYGKLEIVEAGHPKPDENSVRGARRAVEIVREAGEQDTVLLLLSGGGSALFEIPADGLELKDIQDGTSQRLACGADITEINVIRKKLSAVKGGKFAAQIRAGKAYSIILSDVLGDREDMIASGISYPEKETREDAEQIISRYGLRLSEKAQRAIENGVQCSETIVKNCVVGSVGELCQAAAKHAQELGYGAHILTASLQCEAKDAGVWLAGQVDSKQYVRPFALIAGGETVVKLTGNGLGGRNQELALAGAEILAGKENVILFSLGSDGTDGPTDAAGGIVDGSTAGALREKGIVIGEVLQNNDAYHALQAVDGLIMTGATGTNVNDVAVLLVK